MKKISIFMLTILCTFTISQVYPNPTLAASTYQAKVTTKKLAVYSKASTKGKKLGYLKKNQKVKVTSYSSNWVKITYKKKTGYLPKKFTKKYVAPKPYKAQVTATKLTIRAKANTSSKAVGSYKKNTTLTVTPYNSQWVKITYKKKKAFVSKKYIKKVSTTSVAKPVAATNTTTTGTADTSITAITGVQAYRTMDIRLPSKVTASEINSYIAKYEQLTGKTSVFRGQGQQIIDVASSAGINQLILAAMAIHESAYGTNILSVGKNNLFSVAAYDSAPYDSAYKFANITQTLQYQAHFLQSGYLNPSNWKFKGYHLGDGSAGLNYYYATDKLWGEKIANHANKIHPYNAAEYAGVSIMKGSTTAVTLSNFIDDFSKMNIVGKANAAIPLKNSLSGSAVATMPKGATFRVLEKHNNHTFKIEYNGNVYYFNVSLSDYKQHFVITNLLRKLDLTYIEQTDLTKIPAGCSAVYR